MSEKPGSKRPTPKSSKKGKIILLSPAHPLRGGIAAFTERFAMELQNAGYEVVIYSFSLQYPGFLFPGTTQFSNDPPPTGIEIRTCVNSVNPFNWIKIGLELRRMRPDLIIPRYWLPFMGPCLGSILRLAKSNGHSKVVAIADNVLPHEKRPGDRLFTRWFVGSCHAFVVMSKSVLEDLRQFTQKPAACIPHPIYDNYGEKSERAAALTQLGLPVETRYLLFFGFIRDYKGLDLLLEALSDNRLHQMGLKLIVAGEYYGNREKYEAQIQGLGIEKQVVMHTDYIPNEAVRHYFGAADLIVQPYRTATQSGISQMAYHFEKPMLVTNVGGLAEIVPDGKAGYVVPVNPTAIADAIVDFFENKRSEEFTKGVVEGKKRFAWRALVEGVEALMKNKVAPERATQNQLR